MQRFEYCNGNSCAEEMLALGQINMKMWYLFQSLAHHGQLQHGTQAEMVKLYINEELVAYSLLENYETRKDKTKRFADEIYQELGVVHFVTMPKHRKKGYASLLAEAMYTNVIQPLLARHTNINAYVIATQKAVPLMLQTDIAISSLVTQFYSQQSFKEIVVDHIKSY